MTVRGETALVELTPQKAAGARDALVKIMYSRLLLHPNPDLDPDY